MALYDAPTHDGYKILTHTSSRRFAKNGFSQVGNTLFPSNPVNPQAVRKSAIYNKNISGIAEAGYGRRYPYYGLSYAGAGSPRSSVLKAYTGAGSPRGSYLAAYTGAGSPRGSYLAYAGAGSPRSSLLRDAYINDNPPPGTLGVRRPGVAGRPSTRTGISGLADDTVPVDTSQDYNLYPPDTSSGGPVDTTVTAPAPATPSLWGDLTGAFGSLFGTATQAASTSGATAISKAIQGAVNPPPRPTVTSVAKSLVPTSKLSILGMSGSTLLIAGAAAAYFMTRKRAA